MSRKGAIAFGITTDLFNTDFMSHTDQYMETAIGGSVSNYSPVFAQSRERVDHSSPAVEAAIREGERLKSEITKLQARIRLAEETGEPISRVRALERRLDDLVDAWTEFATSDNEPSPGADLDGYISLSDLMRSDLDTGADLDAHLMEVRLATFRDLMRFVFQDGGVCNIDLAFKNFVAVVNRSAPEYLEESGITKADLARIWGETRAATSAREIRMVEKPLKAAGAKGFQLIGGHKSMATRERCRQSAMGNQNRRGGGSRRHALSLADD
jgi:hypothetical protein